MAKANGKCLGRGMRQSDAQLSDLTSGFDSGMARIKIAENSVS